MNATQIIAQIAQARDTMQHLIKVSASLPVRAAQERRIQALKTKLANI